MRIMLLSVLLAIVTILKIHTCTGQNPPSDDSLSLFQNLSTRSSDCYPSRTTKSIEFLKKASSDENDPDLSIARTKLDKLRAYLVKKGFPETPGSLMFLNAQEESLHLECSPDKNKMTRWTSQGRRFDKSFAHTGFSNNRLADQAPSTYLYFRKIICSQVDGGKDGCQHFFYIFTRPSPKVDKPQSYREGSTIEFKCEINPCHYQGSLCKTPFETAPHFHPPISMGWTLPDDARKVITTSSNQTGNMSITVKNYSKEANNEFGDKVTGFPISTTIKIKNAAKKHAGEYECVVIDENGIPSTPAKGSEHHIIYGGRVNVHIREWWWIYVPLLILGILLIIMILAAFCCPPSMEHDSGERYTKEELENQTIKANTSMHDITPTTEIVNINMGNSVTPAVSKAILRSSKSTAPQEPTKPKKSIIVK